MASFSLQGFSNLSFSSSAFDLAEPVTTEALKVYLYGSIEPTTALCGKAPVQSSIAGKIETTTSLIGEVIQ